MKKALFTVFSLILIMGMLVNPASAQAPVGDERADGLTTPQVALPTVIETSDSVDGVYIVLLEDSSLAGYEGDVAGLRATSPSLTGERKLDVTSAASVAYLDYLHTKQDAFLDTARAGLGRSLAYTYRYDVVLNGFAMQLTGAEAKRISKMPGVRAVLLDEIRQLDTDTSPDFLGVSTLWDYTADTTPGDIDSLGEGMLIGVLDTGINMDHPSFAAEGPVDLYVHENPYGTGVFKGLCASDPTEYICNDKLVGVYGYTGDTEALTGEDGHSHGSHTASTSAGNYLDTTYEGIAVSLSGMAPHANIIMYDVCDPDGCANSDSTAAVQQAIIDGVDVINYSIGPSSGESDPYADPVELAMLDAMAAGVLTSTSAGNSGPNPSTVYKAPAWDIVVANSSHDRSFGYEIEVGIETETELIVMIGVNGTGIDFVDDTPQTLKWAGDDAGNVEGCVAFPADFFLGDVALISRGACGFVDKVDNAADAGAVGVIVYNNRLGPAIVMGALETTTIPSIMVDQADGQDAVAYLGAHTGEDVLTSVTDNFTRVLKDEWANIIDSQTSRGPYTTHDILEPEVAAPGTNILAAYWTPGETGPYGQIDPEDEVEVDLMSGTSMASPHVAGAALLLMDLFPSWTPMEIKSALVMTADNNMIKDNGVDPTDPFDVGNGRVDLTKAALIGLVMDETKANFVAAAPSEGGDVRTLNIPSYQESQCVGACSFERTFTSVSDAEATYSIMIDEPDGVTVITTPSSFTIAAGGSQTVQFDIDVSGAEIGTWQFATVTFFTANAFTTGENISDARISMAVMPDAGNLPALVEQTVYRDAGGTVLEDLYSIEITSMTIDQAGLTQADIYDFQLDPDPTNSDAFDDLGQVWYTTFTIPVGTKRMVLEVLETSSSDLDLFWGYGSTPSAATLYDSAATGAALEYYSWLNPWDDPYWVLIQNWDGAPMDDVKLAIGIVPDADALNFEVTGPSAVVAGELFDLEIVWGEPAMEPFSAWYGWFSVGTENGVREVTEIGETELNIYRPYDDVIKEVSAEAADPGDTLTYTLTIEPNMTGGDLVYTLTDQLPAGVTYVPGSLDTVGSSTMATYNEGINAVEWLGTMPKIEYTYIASDNSTNPYCFLPVGSGGYIDAKTKYGYSTQSGLVGDGIYWSYGTLMDGTGYYDQTLDSPYLTDDGYFDMDSASFDMWDYNNYPFPDVTPPNGVFAPFQRDMEIIYDAALNKGVTAVNYGVAWLVELDDVEEYYNWITGLGLSMDYEVFAWKDLDPTIGWPDIIVAFDNVVGDWGDDYWFGGGWGSVGLENFDASVGTTYAYDDYSPASGDIICFDFALSGADPVVITFDVTVDEDAWAGNEVDNTLEHENNGYATELETATASFMVDLSLTDLDLFHSLDTFAWDPTPGSFEDGFALLMDPLEEYYYLDVDNIVANHSLVGDIYPFFLDQTALPDGFFEYWDAKEVNAEATEGWQAIMWDIINGVEPMFFLKVNGTSYDLIDGLQYLVSGGALQDPLRVSGDYPLGVYTFMGNVVADVGEARDPVLLTDMVTVDIEFLAPFDLTDLDLFSSLDLATWVPVDGSFADGFALPLDEVNPYYYLDAENLIANRTIGDGLFPFYLDQTGLPAGFMAYWDAKGVNAGASGATWQGIMYQIIIGNEPMFFLKVDGMDYDLIDGLQYLASSGTAEEPLRVSGDYPFGTYTFDGEVEDEFGYPDEVAVDITFDPLDLTDLDLFHSLDTVVWDATPGSFEEGFGLVMDPLEEYYYLDVDNIVVNRELADGQYGFFLDQTALPAGFFEYWDVKGVNIGAAGGTWQAFMWDIINGEAPMFFLKVDGTSYDLIDGLLFQIGSGETPLRVSGDYPLGLYTFIGDVEDDSGLTDEVTVDIEFLAPFDLTDLDLLSSLDELAWDPVDGTFAAGFVMTMDPVNPYYYLDADNLVTNRTVGDGMYPFYLDQADLPAGFMAYWDAKGVNAGATGGTWQAFMYQIVIGNAPMFYLNVNGLDYDLIDGLQLAIGQGMNPLRVSGDYPFGTYTFDNYDLQDEYGYTTKVMVDITFNDKPVADDQELTTPEDVALAITLTATDTVPGDPLVWIVGTPAHGVLSGTAPDLLYTPDMDYYGPDSFTFKVDDGIVESELATISIDVTSLEDDPIAADDYYETPMGVTLEVAAPGVMTNDYDGDPTDLMLVILGSGPSHGTVTLYGDGSFVYIPTPGYYGPDSFEYTLLSLPTRAFIDQATVYIDVIAFMQYLPMLIR